MTKSRMLELCGVGFSNNEIASQTGVTACYVGVVRREHAERLRADESWRQAQIECPQDPDISDAPLSKRVKNVVRFCDTLSELESLLAADHRGFHPVLTPGIGKVGKVEISRFVQEYRARVPKPGITTAPPVEININVSQSTNGSGTL